MGNNSKHIPVLLKEVEEVLSPKRGETVIDATLGGGGHARRLLQLVGGEGFLLGIDADPETVERFKKIEKAKNVKVAVGNFENIKQIALENGIESVDVILFDFGMSSDQLDDPDRGFSFQKTGLLDMRYNQQAQEKTAADLVNQSSEQELIDIMSKYGEERNSKRIARAIVDRRKREEINHTDQLFGVIKKSLPSIVRFKAGDVARRVFQAFRIAVNNELGVIEKGLKEAFEMLSSGGRMAAISFHSLEDRIVKHFFNDLAKGCVCPPEFPICICDEESKVEILTPKPIVPSEDEIDNNPRSKSAKLRAIKKV